MQTAPTINREVNKRQRDFIHGLVYLGMTPSDAYKRAGFSNQNASGHATQLLAKPHINKYYREQLEKRAIEIQEEREVVTATILVNQQVQAEKLEKLRLKCEQERDYASALGCIREEDKVFGLVRDNIPIDEKQAEIDAAIREQAAKLSASDFLAIPPSIKSD